MLGYMTQKNESFVGEIKAAGFLTFRWEDILDYPPSKRTSK